MEGWSRNECSPDTTNRHEIPAFREVRVYGGDAGRWTKANLMDQPRTRTSGGPVGARDFLADVQEAQSSKPAPSRIRAAASSPSEKRSAPSGGCAAPATATSMGLIPVASVREFGNLDLMTPRVRRRSLLWER